MVCRMGGEKRGIRRLPEKKRPGGGTRPGVDQSPVTDEALLFVVAFGAVLAVAELAKQ